MKKIPCVFLFFLMKGLGICSINLFFDSQTIIQMSGPTDQSQPHPPTTRDLVWRCSISICITYHYSMFTIKGHHALIQCKFPNRNIEDCLFVRSGRNGKKEGNFAKMFFFQSRWRGVLHKRELGKRGKL